jgi:selenocysteine lyase/cysteine desulfurase
MDQQIRDLFAAARSCTYLNTAAIGPLPNQTVRAVASQLEDVASHGSGSMCEWFETRDRVRELVASLLGVEASGIGFTRNTSDGLCAVATGIDWDAGDNIVSFENEFPANYYPWKKLRDEEGVELRLCPERDGGMDLDELCGLIDERTRLITLSAVQYSTGYRLDLERVGQASRAAGALFAVDMIQAFGAVPLDLKACNVDIAAGGSYKWLCAPQGCGILYLDHRARQAVHPTSYSWMGVNDPWNFEKREQPCRRDTAAWETGMSGFSLLYGLEQSLTLLRSIGIGKIARYLRELTDFLCEIIPSDRYSIVSPRAPGEGSQIVCIEPTKGLEANAVAESLRRKNIIVSARGKRVRIAPHFFNNFSDIETFAACLP